MSDRLDPINDLPECGPAIIPLRRSTPEVLEMRNRWEARWAAIFQQEAPPMRMREFLLWMSHAADDDVSSAYEKWGRTPEEHIQFEVRRAIEEWKETA